MSMRTDEKDEKILKAIASRVRPYEDKDVSMATGLSLDVVRDRLLRLRRHGVIEETWKGDRGPFWRLATER